MELVRMTVLVVAGSTTVAFGIVGGKPGLVSWAGSGIIPEIEMATKNRYTQLLIK